jgi:iron complex outermembrane recepter protein
MLGMSVGSRTIRGAAARMVAVAFVWAAGTAGAQDTASPPPAVTGAGTGTGSISGRVLRSDGSPATDAQVRLVDLRRRTGVDANGAFRFSDLAAGEYLVQAESARSGLNVARVAVTTGQDTALEITLDLALHEEVVVVTARPDASALSDIAQPVTVLSGTDLALRLQPTLGETLAQQPGVSSTYFGPGASRPVIRGQGGDRVRILQGGLGTADASNISPDHAVSFDPLAARQIEVVRGPATLLYGSNAVGGVVNVIDARIPDSVPEHALSGKLDLTGGTAAEEKSGAFALNGGAGNFAWHADFLKRQTEDLKIPGFAESAAQRAEEEAEGAASEEEHAETEGVLPNSAVENTSGAIGASLVGNRGFLGASFTGFDTLYGVPGHAHEGDESVRIDMKQRRGDVRGEIRSTDGFFRGIRVRLGLADYEHTELEGDAVGTVFKNKSWEGRVEIPHGAAGPFTGTVGVQGANRDFEAIGEEAVVPPTVTKTWSAFLFEEAGKGAWRLQAGGRVDRQDVDAKGADPASRSFTGISGSLGVLWKGATGTTASLAVARSVKLPTAEELFSNGPHVATRAFEVGNPDLDKERSLGVDLSLRKRSERVRGELNLFANQFDGFIYEQATDLEEDGLPVFQFVQDDARFLGAEASLTFDLLHAEPHHLDFEAMADYVRAELTTLDEPLPRIPPLRYGAALHYRGEALSGRIEVRRTEKQDRVSLLERETAGYTWVNASLGYRHVVGRTVLDFLLQGNNLTDEEGRTHASFLKDLVPLPGRDVRLTLRVAF